MSRLLKTALLGSLILAIPTLALAQAKQGDKDVSLSGKFSSLRSSGPTISSGEFDLGLGYFVTDRVEIAVAPTFNVSATTTPDRPAKSDSTNWEVDGGVSIRGQFFLGSKTATVKPYGGAAFVVRSFKTSVRGSFADNLFAGVLFGVKSYFAPKFSFDVNGQFAFKANDPGALQLWGVTVGITHLF